LDCNTFDLVLLSRLARLFLVVSSINLSPVSAAAATGTSALISIYFTHL